MRIHLIAIGGAIMHQLALALQSDGHQVTGSDDVIKDPSKSNLKKEGLLPDKEGFYLENIHPDLDMVIVGMHAKGDNIELKRAQELGLKVLSFPEFIYNQSIDKKRVVIAGSHGKTSITSMIMYVLNACNIDFDYLVGSSVDGFPRSVKVSKSAPIIIIEGDEYLTSPLYPEPKFINYHAHIATLSGIEWDHVNVFPTEENYQEQFKKLVKSIEPNGTLYYYDSKKVFETIQRVRQDIITIPYKAIPHEIIDGQFFALWNNQKYSLDVFGEHNMQNIEAAHLVCSDLGVKDEDFFKHISNFKGAGRRLETILITDDITIYKDFAHSPSKVKATVNAVRQKYPHSKIIGCFELHTFSTLTRDFLPNYRDTMKELDVPVLFLHEAVVAQKGNEIYTETELRDFFNEPNLKLFTNEQALLKYLKEQKSEQTIYLMMTSGQFGGMDLMELA